MPLHGSKKGWMIPEEWMYLQRYYPGVGNREPRQEQKGIEVRRTCFWGGNLLQLEGG